MKKVLKMRFLSEIPREDIEWLWYPYIPFGKTTIIHGDPGEGKTTLALRLAAACSNGTGLPGMNLSQAFPVIYQTAEDGLGDTIKPRLEDAGADQDMILNIVEDDCCLDFLDERIEEAINQVGARLFILDPLQAYIGDKVDMNRANEVRHAMNCLMKVAERTSCAIVLVGHMNKVQGLKSSYRGIGSIDFRAAVRSLLVVGRLRKERTTRVVVHDKSSLAPEGKSMAFHLGDDEGFRWLEGYDNITADELLGGGMEKENTKTSQAYELILEMLEENERVYSQDVYDAAKRLGISKRTVDMAKARIPEVKSQRIGNRSYWWLPGEPCNIATGVPQENPLAG